MAGNAPPDSRTAPLAGGFQSGNPALAPMVAHALPTAPTNPTRAFGRFELRQLLGKSAGTMAWLAFDPVSGHEVMLTMPRVQPIDTAGLEHWQHDARLAARLNHPNLAPVAEAGVQDHWPFVCVDRAHGVTLKEWITAHAHPSPQEVVGWACDLLHGLAFAHEAGVSHLDPQLHNILIDERGSVRLMALAAAGDTARAQRALAAARANERTMYVRGVVSTLGNAAGDSAKNVLDIDLVSSEREFKPDHYTVVQPQGIDKGFGPWIAEVTRPAFLSQIGHAIVHSKVLVIDPLSKSPVVVTGSHNFSTPASRKNDENLVIVRGHPALAKAYATHVMSVYQHYRYRSYVRETLAQGRKPWSYLDDNDKWLKAELKSKALEIDFWA